MKDIFHWKAPETWPHDWDEHTEGVDYFDTFDARFLWDEFRERYSHIVCYHGCRPKDVKSYYEKGLLLSSTEKLKETARELFLGSETPWISEQRLEEAESTFGIRDNGNLFVVLDDDHLIQYAGHYCIYGSERLLAVANMVSARDILRSFGKPTMLKINVPIADVSDYEIDLVIKTILEALPFEGDEPYSLNHTLLLQKPVSPDNVLEHYHPEEIFDQHEGRMVYRYGKDPEYIFDSERY